MDKMARYEGASHMDGIEMLTGLRYRDGERSHGISTGDMSPALIRGDAGIAIPVDKEGRYGNGLRWAKKEKKKTDNGKDNAPIGGAGVLGGQLPTGSG